MSELSTNTKAETGFRKLSAALLYQQEVLSRSRKRELGQTIVDQISSVFQVRKALLFSGRPLRIHAISELADFDRTSPLLKTLENRVRKLSRTFPNDEPTEFSIDDLADAETIDQNLLGNYLLWLPIADKTSGELIGGLLLSADAIWSSADLLLAKPIRTCVSHAWKQASGKRLLANSRRLTVFALILIAIMWIPVRLSVLAPAQIVPRNPFPVTAPFPAVIRELYVQPYEQIEAGQVLASYDDTQLLAERDLAHSTLQVVKRELESLEQSAFLSSDSKGQIAVWQAKLAEQQAVFAYTQYQLERVQLIAERPGVVVFDDPEYWIGRPVTTGESIFLIADPDRVAIRLDLPIADLVPLRGGAEIQLFLDIAPNHALSGTLDYLGYSAIQTPDNVLVYRGLASLASDEGTPRLGARGTVKLYGDRVTLAYYLFRKPWSQLRQFFGI